MAESLTGEHMKTLKQPWFLILLAVTIVYTYQFYNGTGTLTVGTNQAQATEGVEDQSTKEKTLVEVKLSESFPVKNVAVFDFSTYLPLKIKMNNTANDKVIVSLIGEGSEYRNKGDKLKDWFDISNKGNVLKIKSPNKNEFKGLSSMKELAKKISGNEDRNLTLIVEFPQDHQFDQVNFQVVSADLYADGLKFKKLNMANVSGDMKIKNSVGEQINVDSVSGNNEFQIQGMKKGKFTSVSGDTILRSENINPEISFESVSGDLSLEFPSESQVEVKFSSMTGELVNDFGRSKEGANKVTFSSLSGDAKISKIQKAL